MLQQFKNPFVTKEVAHSLLEKIVTGSTENQLRIVDRGCCFSRVGPVTDQQRVVDQSMLIWSQKKTKNHFFKARLFQEKNYFLLHGFCGKKLFLDYPDINGSLTLPA